MAFIYSVGLSFALLVVPADGMLPALVARASFLALPLSLWGVAWFTRRRSPFPAVAAMVCLAIIQILAWGVVAFR